MGDLVRNLEDKIIKGHLELCINFGKCALGIFDIGSWLAEVKTTLDHGDWLPWVRQRLPFSDRTAAKYMRTYEAFKDIDRKTIAEMSASEAYVAAGIRKMIDVTPKAQGKRNPLDPFAEIRKMKFKGKSLSGLPLKNTRMAWLGDNLVIECAHIGTATKMSICLGVPKDQDPAIYAELRDNLVIAWEVYYYKVEQEQAAGRISYSETTAFPELMKNGKGTIPSVPPSVLGKHRRRPRA